MGNLPPAAGPGAAHPDEAQPGLPGEAVDKLPGDEALGPDMEVGGPVPLVLHYGHEVPEDLQLSEAGPDGVSTPPLGPFVIGGGPHAPRRPSLAW